LIPTPVDEGMGKGEEHWIYPPTMTPKFSGKRLRVPPGGIYECAESAPYAFLVWQGEATVAPIGGQEQPFRAGDEAFVSADTAAAHRFTARGTEGLELFKFFPAAT